MCHRIEAKYKNFNQMSKRKNQITGNSVAEVVAETQQEIRAKLFKRGERTRLKEKTKLSAYKIRVALTSKNPDLQVLAKIEKALNQAA